MQLVLDTNDLWVKRKSKRFEVSSETTSRLISPHKLTSIAVLNRCIFTSAAMLLAAEHDIPVLFFDRSGDPVARLKAARPSNIATLRRAQVLFDLGEDAPAWALGLFTCKAEGQLSNLLFFKENASPEDLTAVSAAITNVEMCLEKLTLPAPGPLDDLAAVFMGWEGTLARHYWAGLSAALPPAVKFDGRSRRPAKDMFNCALNYGYGMLYNVVESAILGTGLDPTLGVLHADQWNEPTLSFDLIEPFRPFVDRMVASMLVSGQLMKSHFEVENGDFWLGKDGRRILIPAFNDLLETPVLFEQREDDFRTHIYKYVGGFAQMLKRYMENARFEIKRIHLGG